MDEIEELRARANELGYKLVKKKKYVRFMKCLCGANSHSLWHSTKGYGVCFKCNKCGLSGPFAKTEERAKVVWNEMIVSSLTERRKHIHKEES